MCYYQVKNDAMLIPLTSQAQAREAQYDTDADGNTLVIVLICYAAFFVKIATHY